MPLSVILLHDDMVDKNGANVSTSITLIDVHDISRSCKTFGAKNFYISHSSEKMRGLAKVLIGHWEHGYGSTYNVKRKDALSIAKVVVSLEEAIEDLKDTSGREPKLVVTSAKSGGDRIGFNEFNRLLKADPDTDYLLALGTGWGMSDNLLSKGSLFLDPIKGPGEFNHLSVRSALAIMLSRIS